MGTTLKILIVLYRLFVSYINKPFHDCNLDLTETEVNNWEIIEGCMVGS